MFVALTLAASAASLASGHVVTRDATRAAVSRNRLQHSAVTMPRFRPSAPVTSQATWSRQALASMGRPRFHQVFATKERRDVDKSELAVVSGGGSGIGRAVSLRLAKRGMSVIIIGRRAAPLEETKKMAEDAGAKGEIICVTADVTNAEGRAAIADKVKELQGQGVVLRGLVHNAAVNTPCKKMMELTEDDWLKVSDINVNGPLFLTQALYPLFGKDDTDKNRIMMLSSVARTCSGLPAYGPYCVSKLTFYGMHLMFKEELCKGATPVFSASLIPGEVDTEMQRQTAYGQADGVFPDHLVKYWREIQESGQLLPPEVTGAFMEYVLLDTVPDEYQKDEWFIYDKKHHKDWAYEFPDVKIVEPQGLF